MFANACIHAEDDFLDASLDLTNKEGILAAKMKIALSPISGSGDYIEEFMKKVDGDVRNMSSLPTLQTLGQVLQITRKIMDNVSQVVHLSKFEPHYSISADRDD